MKKLNVLLMALAGVCGIVHGKRSEHANVVKLENKVKKTSNYYDRCAQWLSLKQSGKGLEEFFETNEYKKIAIYGIGILGERLVKELENSNIEIKYTLDKNTNIDVKGIEIKTLDEARDDVEIVVGTNSNIYDSIKDDICKKFSCPIITIDVVIDSVYKKYFSLWKEVHSYEG